MKDGLTTHVVLAAGPNLLATFLKHYLTPDKNREDAEGKDTARVQLMYDEVFRLIKRVLKISTLHTADALQKVCQQRTPVPPWAAMHRVRIPQATSARAAEVLTDALGGEDMAFKVAGGTKWWQVRAGSGVECEWIAMKKTYGEEGPPKASKRSGASTPPEGDCGFVPEMDRLRCMLFIHGGGYYCGSINTHHYFIWRLAKKIRGRVFAVNYRMAPQYPFPCAIQDVLSSYLYLIDPPVGADHRPVDPKNIIIAGDSAGGGLSLVLLQILRDMNLPLPGGSVVMSPWADLTHSFPSTMANTKTDVIPPYSFIHKPSSLWPPPTAAMTHDVHSRIVNRAHTAAGEHYERRQSYLPSRTHGAIYTSDTNDLGKMRAFLHEFAQQHDANAVIINPADKFAELSARGGEGQQGGPTTLASGDNALRTCLGNKDIVIDTQIQLYATNAQLCHPYVSPVLGYFGGLPPMLVIAGDSEVLRDEIIYLAHKTANPAAHPVREDVRAMMPHWEGIEEKHPPTDVHLQVYDGVGHDIPLFCMTKPGHCAVRAIGSFARWVTPRAPGSHPLPPNVPDETGMSSGEASPLLDQPLASTPGSMTPTRRNSGEPTPPQVHGDLGYVNDRLRQVKLEDDGRLFTSAGTPPRSQASETDTPQAPSQPPSSSASSSAKHQSKRGSSVQDKPSPNKGLSWGGLPRASPGRAGWPGIYHGPNPFTDHMIRERVDMVGLCRPLEPASELGAMQVPPATIGMIKVGPALRYLEGQAKWDHRFGRTYKRVARHREANIKRAVKETPKIIERWRRKGSQSSQSSPAATPASSTRPSPRGSFEDEPTGETTEEVVGGEGSIAVDETWLWALADEMPPPSAIVSRRDLPEGRTLALQADRIDAPGGDDELNTLSVWVILAQLFSSGEKDRVEDAKVMQKDARKDRAGKRWSGLFGKGKDKEGGMRRERRGRYEDFGERVI